MTVDQNILVKGNISDATLEAFKKWLEEAKRSGDSHIAQNVGYFDAKKYLTEVAADDAAVSNERALNFFSDLNTSGNFIYVDADYDNENLSGLFREGLLFSNTNDDGALEYLEGKRRIQQILIDKALKEKEANQAAERARKAAEREQLEKDRSAAIDRLLHDQEEERKKAQERDEKRRKQEEDERKKNEAREAMELEARNEAEQYRRNEQLERQRTARYYDPETGEYYVPGEREALLKRFFDNSHLGAPTENQKFDFQQYLRELTTGQMRISGVDQPECGTVPIKFDPTGNALKLNSLQTISFSLVDQPGAQSFEISF